MTDILRIQPIFHLSLLCLFLLGSTTLRAQVRASGEQYDKARVKASLDSLLVFPGRNYQKIKGLYLSPQSEALSETIETLEGRLGGVSGIEDRTALHLLLVHANKSNHIQSNMPVRHAMENKGLSPQVLKSILEEDVSGNYQDRILALLPELIRDYQELVKKKPSAKLLPQLTKTINSILEHSDKHHLSAPVRTLVIKEYLQSPDNPLRWSPPRKVASLYRKLEVLEELVSLSPKDIGLDGEQSQSKIADLVWEMQILQEAGLGNNAIGLADVLLSFPAEMIKNDLVKIVDVYVSFRPGEALVKFQALSDKNPELKVKLYRASCSVNQFGDQRKREDHWLETCMRLLKEKKEKCQSKSLLLTAYYAMAHELECAKDFSGALYVANAVLQMEEYTAERIYWNIALLAGRCYRAQGEKDKANEIYKRCLHFKDLDSALFEHVSSVLNRKKTESF